MRKFIGIILIIVSLFTLVQMPSANIRGGYEAIGFLIGVALFAVPGCYLLFSKKKDKSE